MYISEKTLYLKEIASLFQEHFGYTISLPMIHYLRQKYVHRYRKQCTFISRNRKLQRVKESRRVYKQNILQISIKKIFFQDESHFQTSLLCQRYAYAEIGEEIINKTQRLDTRRWSLLSTIG